MKKSGYENVMNVLFIVMVGLTFFNLYKNVIWLSYVSTALFILFIVLHSRDYIKDKKAGKKIYILTLIISINLLLANAVIVLAEYVYPY